METNNPPTISYVVAIVIGIFCYFFTEEPEKVPARNCDLFPVEVKSRIVSTDKISSKNGNFKEIKLTVQNQDGSKSEIYQDLKFWTDEPFEVGDSILKNKNTYFSTHVRVNGERVFLTLGIRCSY